MCACVCVWWVVFVRILSFVLLSPLFRLGYMCAMKEDKFRSNGGSAGPFMGMDLRVKGERWGGRGRDVSCELYGTFICAPLGLFRVTLALVGWLVG